MVQVRGWEHKTRSMSDFLVEVEVSGAREAVETARRGEERWRGRERGGEEGGKCWIEKWDEWIWRE